MAAPAWPGSAGLGPARHGVAWRGTAGAAGLGRARRGMAWHGSAWLGAARHGRQPQPNPKGGSVMSERSYQSTHRQLTRGRQRRIVVTHATLDAAMRFCHAHYGPGGDWWIVPVEVKQ